MSKKESDDESARVYSQESVTPEDEGAAGEGETSQTSATAGASATEPLSAVEGATLAQSREEKGKDQDDEVQRLKLLIQEHDERWEQTHKILTEIRGQQRSNAGPLAVRRHRLRRSEIVLLVAVAVLASSTGVLYLNSRSGSRVEIQKNLVLPKQQRPSASATRLSAEPTGVQKKPVASAQSQRTESPPASARDDQSEAPVPAEPPNQAPRHAAPRTVRDSSSSRELSDYLHEHRLPYVDALVFTNGSEPILVTLFGRVRTEHGRKDAESKSQDFLNKPRLHVQNHITVDPTLASNPPARSYTAPESPASGGAMTPSGDPCLCLNSESYCKKTCGNSAAADAPNSLGGSIGGLFQTGVQLKQCNENCEQTRVQCVSQCGQSGGSEQPPAGPSEPPGGSDQGGPDEPPG